ncbi:hypothetical protein [Rhizohabitans arisaemae]|uniref:hypothetical protein n=1 Tax=Rhizohabitans arisaemae TaxID=2720610 RepID=UPI0024B15ABC|nr:hypothetical protein [Rhizohabitans arisaemae]
MSTKTPDTGTGADADVDAVRETPPSVPVVDEQVTTAMPIPATRSEEREDRADEQAPARFGGLPAGGLALAAVSAVTVAGAGLFQLTGWWGLAGAGAVAGAGAAARFGRGRRRADEGNRSGRSAERPYGSARTSRTGRTGSGFAVPGASRTGGTHRRGGAGRPGVSGPAPAGQPRTGRPGPSARTDGSTPGGRGRTARTGKPRTVPRAVERAVEGARRIVRGTGGTAARRARRIKERTADRTGGTTRRTGRKDRTDDTGGDRVRSRTARVRRAVSTRARRAGAWVDRRTGRRLTRVWRSGRRIAGPLARLIAWILRWWRDRRARTAEQAPAPERPDRAGERRKPPENPKETPKTGPVPAGNQPRPGPHGEPNPRPGADNTTTPNPNPTHRRRTPMSGFPLAVASAEMNAAVSAYAPADMFAVARELDQLPEIPVNVAMALRTYAARLQGSYPINPAVVEALFELYKLHTALVQAAQEIGPLFRRLHEDDLRRDEAPRTGEPLWNV